MTAETQNTEWKQNWHDEYLKWVCGFANARGGRLYIGTDANGIVIGLENSRKLLEDIPNKIRNSLGIVPDVNLLTDNGLDYIEIIVAAYPVPISYRGVYYYRSGSTLQTLSGAELESFILRKRGVSWDSVPLPGFTPDDIDDAVLERFKKTAVKKGRLDESIFSESKAELLDKLRLTSSGYLTNAAMLLFGKDPDRWLLGAYTKIGFFENDADILYQDEIHGSILEQIDKIIEVAHLKYMKAKISYEGVYRRERYFVPDAALREALLNALCHKQYESCTPIQVSIYEDRLYIANCCSLPDNWTAENLTGKHASRPYNKAIANVFYLSGLIESWGRGIEKIMNACREDGSPMPEYIIHSGDIMIKFTAAEDRIVRSFTQKVTDRVTDRVTDKELKILILLNEDPGYTMPQLAQKAGISRKTVAERLKSLREKEIIERKGSDRKGYWRIIDTD